MAPHLRGGHGKKYAQFLVKELKVFIDKTYRTLADRQNTAIMGVKSSDIFLPKDVTGAGYAAGRF